jgi:hypothetical protein
MSAKNYSSFFYFTIDSNFIMLIIIDLFIFKELIPYNIDPIFVD